jgi:hypothetical protein
MSAVTRNVRMYLGLRVKTFFTLIAQFLLVILTSSLLVLLINVDTKFWKAQLEGLYPFFFCVCYTNVCRGPSSIQTQFSTPPTGFELVTLITHSISLVGFN